jgi:uncharacterized protein YdbL (DUF1318 family)
MARLYKTNTSEISSMHRVFKSLLLVTALIGGIAAASPAFAQNAEELRRDGAACEQADGYLRALNPGSQGAVDTINAQRRDFYGMRAAEEGVDVGAVAAVFATEIANQPNYRSC